MHLETCEGLNKTETCDLIDLDSPRGSFHAPETIRGSGIKESHIESSIRKEMNVFLKSMPLVDTSQNQDKIHKLNLARSSSNQSNVSCETVKMRDIQNSSNLLPIENTEYNSELQKLVSFVDEEKYSDRSSASPEDFKDKKETDGESSELSFECPSMEKFRMMEDHSFVQSTIIDRDMERVEGLLEGWTSDLKKKILAEFSQSKIRLLEYYRQQIALVKEKHDKEMNQLKKDNESFRELAKNFEKSLEKKDETISDLASTVQSCQNKMQLQKYFSDWKVRHSEVTREKLNASLAARHYNQSLMRKVVKTWHAVVDNRVQRDKSSQVETEGVIEGLRKEYEDKLTVMNRSLELSRKEIERLNRLRDVSDDTRKTFPLGVCNLDLDAVFQEGQCDTSEKLSRSDGARNIYTGRHRDPTSCLTPRHLNHFSPQLLHHEEPTYFSDPNPPARKTATIHRKPTTLHFPTKIKSSKPKQIKVIPSKRTNQNITSNILGNSLAPPMTSVVVERHHPINKETIGQALACKFPVDSMRMKDASSLKKKSGQSTSQLIRVLN